MDQRDIDDYQDLIDGMLKVLNGRKLDDTIPALTGLLSHAIFHSGVDKKECIAYIVSSIDRYFEELK